MFMVHGKDGVRPAEEDPEKISLLDPNPLLPTAPIYQPFEKVSPIRRYLRGSLQISKTQAVAGILLGLLLLAMILMLVAEAIRETDRPNPFLVASFQGAPPVTISLLGENYADAWMQGQNVLTYRRNLELMLYNDDILPKKGSPSCLLQRFLKGNVSSGGLNDCAIIVEHMKRVLGGCIDTALLPDECKPPVPNNCSTTYPYRTFNGSCNNLEHPDWGMALTAFKRLRRPIYADGVAAPRISLSGEELPGARYLSNELYTHHSRPRANCTVLTLYLGLFMDHDIIRIGSKTGHKGASISCCDPKVLNDPALLHPECMPISVPDDDPFYGPLNVTCLDFVRSAPVPGECPGQREQMNLVTSYLDLSGVYGSFDEDNRALRSFKNGTLNVFWLNNTAMLPQGHHISYQCGFPNRNQYCFRAGDMRANEQVELTALHTLWFREHNRIAVLLSSLNPQWDDERVFQESRRIAIAELQHIAFNEFLPVILGADVISEHNLTMDPEIPYEGYNPGADASIYNVFGASAFRVGHSLIEGTLELIGKGYETERQIPLHTVFLNPHLFYENSFDLLLRGLVRERAQSVDSYITDEVRNRLFQPQDGKYGMDLSAIGIQRGRDQGIPGYVEWRRFCNLPEVNSWEDLFSFMDAEHVQRLSKVYNFIEDIDLTPAALSENHLPGALVGPIHACLIARQFHQMRVGDRFWFETQNQPGSFTPEQLAELYKSSMARILCDNSDDIEEVQRQALRAISPENPVMNCSEIREVNLRIWTQS